MAFAPLPHSLRHYVENILTPGEAETLTGFTGKVPFDIGAIPKVVDEMKRLGAVVTPKSYGVRRSC